jgi:hypothetical protein
VKVTIYRAADAFLYLPTYLAEYTGIFRTLDPNLDVTFETPRDPASSDLCALNALEKHLGDGSIPIAVCDPLVIFEKGSEAQKFRVLGALITKPPFWAVNKIDEEFLEEKSIGLHFEQAIFYDHRLLTGHFIGRRLAKMTHPHLSEVPVSFGEELPRLIREQQSGKKAVAVTADIVTLAQEAGKNNVRINHRYSRNEFYQDFLTTGLVTTNAICEKHSEAITKVLLGIQRAIFILRSSKAIALDVCEDFADPARTPALYQPGQTRLSRSEIEWIIDLIQEEEFYPLSLSIAESQWNGAISARARADMWEHEDELARKNLYSKLVIPTFLERARLHWFRELDVREPAPPRALDILLCTNAPLWVRYLYVLTLVAGALSLAAPATRLVQASVASIFLACLVTSFFRHEPVRRRLASFLATGNRKRLFFALLALLTLLTGGIGVYFVQTPWIAFVAAALLGCLISTLMTPLSEKLK